MAKAEKFEDYDWNYKEAIEEARSQGFAVLQSRATLLLLDIDTDLSLAQYARFLPMLQDKFDLMETGRWLSQSGKNWHIVVACKPLDTATRLGLQVVLGSDPKREALALAMLQDGIENPSWLFKPPAK